MTPHSDFPDSVREYFRRPLADDEMLYSALARCYLLSPSASPAAFILRILETKNCELSVSVENIIKHVVDKEFFGSTGRIIKSHTLYDYFSRFAPAGVPRRPSQAATDLLTTGRFHNEKSSLGRAVVEESLRDCPLCSAEHYQTDGFRPWLRSHNLPGVMACWKHGVRLRKSQPRPSSFRLPPAEEVESIDASVEEIWFARTSRAILLNEQTAAGVSYGWLEPCCDLRRNIAAPSCRTASRICGAYPTIFLESLGLSAKAIGSGIHSIQRGDRGIGDTRIRILLAHLPAASTFREDETELDELLALLRETLDLLLASRQ
jgi:hypothetical protein